MPKYATLKTSGDYSVEIWSAEEMGKQEPFTLGCWGADVDEVTRMVSEDPDFSDRIRRVSSPEDVREIVAQVLCARTRQETRKYGIQH